jgi:hypothetical protein
MMVLHAAGRRRITASGIRNHIGMGKVSYAKQKNKEKYPEKLHAATVKIKTYFIPFYAWIEEISCMRMIIVYILDCYGG